jgi:hypothetical protein
MVPWTSLGSSLSSRKMFRLLHSKFLSRRKGNFCFFRRKTLKEHSKAYFQTLVVLTIIHKKTTLIRCNLKKNNFFATLLYRIGLIDVRNSTEFNATGKIPGKGFQNIAQNRKIVTCSITYCIT